MTTEEIRQSFVQFFESHGHLELASSPLIPFDDPSVLFTIAGMQQMIPYFLGDVTPPARRLVTIQKCLRTIDLDEIGDTTHLTFFEMLGNFSVGDYFKREALHLSWEYLTETVALDPARLSATIFPGDDEAYAVWREIGLPTERIGEDPTNWWVRPGLAGPAGPNSEIYYDRGAEHGCGPEASADGSCRAGCEGCTRYLEIWNNVFMQYYVNDRGEVQRPLAMKNIDTGQGLERLALVLQGVDSVYETDGFAPVIASITQLSGKSYGRDTAVDRSLRIIADHSRALTIAIADGAMPANEGRGYVLRRLLRRAVLRGRMLGISDPFLTQPVDTVITMMRHRYPEVERRRDIILMVVRQEEERFAATLNRGLPIVQDVVARAQETGGAVSGRDMFTLSDTYGFPPELTQELAAERGLTVDMAAYHTALEEQRTRAREARASTERPQGREDYAELAERVEPSLFVGYSETEWESQVVGILVDGRPADSARSGDSVDVVLDSTPFYAESGGQVGDTGALDGPHGRVKVTDTRRQGSLIAHAGTVTEGEVVVGERVRARVDSTRRAMIKPHHSATHLLHLALRQVLGPEATQAGSLVAPDRLRFDFRWPRPLTSGEMTEIQDFINRHVFAAEPVTTTVMPFDEAIATGAMALFGEKYADRVRVVTMGDSRELCGGTHVSTTAEVGPVIITSESGIGSGIRRIEAVAGPAAYRRVQGLERTVTETAQVLDTSPDRLVERVHAVVGQWHEAERRVNQLTRQLVEREAAELTTRAESLDRSGREQPTRLVVHRVGVDANDVLRELTVATRKALGTGIVVLGSVIDGQPQFAAAVSSDLVESGYSARAIGQKVGAAVRGGAGGSDEFAQGGGRDASGLDPGLDDARRYVYGNGC